MSSISVSGLVNQLPAPIANNEKLNALGTSIASSLVALDADVLKLRIYADIDNLPEDLCDILAEDLNISWWDYTFPVADKRSVLKSSWETHKHKGTKGAVLSAVRSVYPSANLIEWWEYNANPYHFKMTFDAESGSDLTKLNKVVSRIAEYKNLRSVMDALEYVASGRATAYEATSFTGETLEIAVSAGR